MPQAPDGALFLFRDGDAIRVADREGVLSGATLACSPDGSALAYLRALDRQPALVLRELDTGRETLASGADPLKRDRAGL